MAATKRAAAKKTAAKKTARSAALRSLARGRKGVPLNADDDVSVYDEDEGPVKPADLARGSVNEPRGGLKLSSAAVASRRAAERTAKESGKAIVVETHSMTRKELEGATKRLVKAVGEGFYNLKRRRIGEVFALYTRGAGELPGWVIDIKDAEPGQDEGTRGLHSGGREDDRIRAERGIEVEGGEKVQKSRARYPGVPQITDPTIVDDSLPLGEGGNERRPRSGGAGARVI